MNLQEQATQPLDPEYRLIPLTQGQFAKVDPEDYDWLMQWKWCAAWDKDTQKFYAIRGQYRPGRGPKCIRMAREIAKAPDGVLVDHWNHDTLDNRRLNLRKADESQNCMNRKVCGSSGLKGVWPIAGKWRAVIKCRGKRKHLGYFSTPELAYAAYCAAAKELHGEFACF